jgi:hypothetical protein
MNGQILTITPLSGGAFPGDAECSASGGSIERLAAMAAAWKLASRELGREISPSAALVLAEPRAGQSAGEMAWHTPLEGFARELSGLPSRERVEADDILRTRATELAELGAWLALSPDPRSRRTARLISRVAAALAAGAAGIPGPETVWMIDGTPVLTGWGIPPPPDPAVVAPSEVEVAVPFARGPLTGPLLRREDALEPAFLPGTSDTAGPVALQAALLAICVFLATWLVFWLVSPGFREAMAAIPSGKAFGGSDPSREVGLRTELALLKELYLERLVSCRPQDSEPFSEETPLSFPEPERADGVPPPSPGELPLALEAAPPPPPPPPPPPQANPMPAPIGPKPDAAKPVAPKPGGRLVIPEGATDASFLEGCWKSDSGIVRKDNKQPLFCYYCFDGNGRARVRVEELDGNGRVEQTCTATATARMSGGELIIRDTGAVCPEGGKYVPDTVVCAPSSEGAADCTLQSDGGRRFGTRITRQGG